MRLYAVSVAVLLATSAGCDASRLDIACTEVGLCDAPPPEPEAFTIVLDGTPGSTASPASVEPVLAAVFERVVDRPSSSVHIFAVGTGADDSGEVASATVPEPPRRVRNPSAHRTQVIASLRDALMPRISEALGAAATQRRSAIAETITLAARSSSATDRRGVLVVVSDLREMMRGAGGLDLECPRELPTSARFARSLERRGLLGPGALEGWEVVLVDGGLPAFANRRRCDLSIRRADDLRALWTETLLASGATRVVVAHGVPNLDDAAEPTEPADPDEGDTR